MVCVLAVAANGSAAFINWADWTSASGSNVIGTIGGANVTYSGTYNFVQTGSPSDSHLANYWTEGSPAPYTGNSVVDNAPTPREMISLYATTTNTLTFSQAITNPVMTIVSMGQYSLPVTYDFNADFTVLSEGQGYFGNGYYSEDDVNEILTGYELHAAIQFIGTFTQISWTSSAENWHGFTVGAPVPEPATLLLLGSGLVGLVGAKRRKNRLSATQ